MTVPQGVVGDRLPWVGKDKGGNFSRTWNLRWFTHRRIHKLYPYLQFFDVQLVYHALGGLFSLQMHSVLGKKCMYKSAHKFMIQHLAFPVHLWHKAFSLPPPPPGTRPRGVARVQIRDSREGIARFPVHFFILDLRIFLYLGDHWPVMVHVSEFVFGL